MALTEGILPKTYISPQVAETHTSILNSVQLTDFNRIPGWIQTPDPNGASRSIRIRNSGVENRAVDTELIFHHGFLDRNHLSSFYQTASGERVEGFVAHINDHQPLIGRNREETLTAGVTYRPPFENGFSFLELNHEEQLASATAWSSVTMRLSKRGAARLLDVTSPSTSVDVVITHTIDGQTYTLKVNGSRNLMADVTREDLITHGVHLPTVIFYPTGIVLLADGTKLQIDTAPVASHAYTRLQRSVFVAGISATENGKNLFVGKSK